MAKKATGKELLKRYDELYKNKQKRGKRASKEEWLRRFKEKHGDQYNYQLTDKETLIPSNEIATYCTNCKRFFHTTAGKHAAGDQCACLSRGELLEKFGYIKSKEKWIEDFIGVHGNKYDYKKMPDKLAEYSFFYVICPIHGEVKTTARSHLHGSCAKCEQKKAYVERCNSSYALLYIIRCWNDEEEFYKIGITSRTVKERFNGIGCLPYNYEVIKTIEGSTGDIFDIEQELHGKNKEYRYGPKIDFAGSSECFSRVTI